MGKKAEKESTETTLKKYFSAEETAERLGVARTWIWNKARSGEIPCFKIGKYYFFIPEEVDAWMEKHAQTA